MNSNRIHPWMGIKFLSELWTVYFKRNKQNKTFCYPSLELSNLGISFSTFEQLVNATMSLWDFDSKSCHSFLKALPWELDRVVCQAYCAVANIWTALNTIHNRQHLKWFRDPSISAKVSVSTRHDTGLDMRSLLDTPILLWVWLLDFFHWCSFILFTLLVIITLEQKRIDWKINCCRIIYE